MLLRFTVKAIYVSSSTSVWICMNEWNRIPITWLSDASPKARGQELVASPWTCRLCPPTCTCVQLNELNHKSLSMFDQISVHFAEMSIWFGNILLTEWKWMRALDHWWSILFTYRLCTFNHEFCDMKSLQNIASFTKYSSTICMHIH